MMNSAIVAATLIQPLMNFSFHDGAPFFLASSARRISIAPENAKTPIRYIMIQTVDIRIRLNVNSAKSSTMMLWYRKVFPPTM